MTYQWHSIRPILLRVWVCDHLVTLQFIISLCGWESGRNPIGKALVYKRLLNSPPSIHPSVCLSVRPSVHFVRWQMSHSCPFSELGVSDFRMGWITIISHYSEGWVWVGFEFCCTRPGTKPPFAIGYIYGFSRTKPSCFGLVQICSKGVQLTQKLEPLRLAV